MISAPLIQLYYTQFVGDAVTVPTIKATAGFQGIALIDSDPYAPGGINWYTNQVRFLISPFELHVTVPDILDYEELPKTPTSHADYVRTTSFVKFATLSLTLL